MEFPTCDTAVNIPPASKLNAEWLVEQHSIRVKQIHIKLRNCKTYSDKQVLTTECKARESKIKYYKNYYGK